MSEEETKTEEPLAEEETEPVKPKSADDCPFCTGRMVEESSVSYREYLEVIQKCDKCGFTATFRR